MTVTMAPSAAEPGAARELSPADYARLARELKLGGDERLEPLRVAFLSSFTFGFIDPFFVVEAARRNHLAETYYGGFAQFEQELAEGSKLYEFRPDVLVIAMRAEDVEPDATARYAATGGRRYTELVAELCERIVGLVEAFRRHSAAPVLVANFAPPARPPFGIFDANLAGSLTYEIGAANLQLQRRLSGCAGAIVWDYAGLVRACGSESWTDVRLWALARNPVAARHQPALARHLARTISAVRSRPAKCLVLDLDNTLWGGAVGDDGLHGIALGDDFPGNAFKMFQRSVLGLTDRGILLAIASKNDPEVVDQVLREHPEMLLRWEHIAAARIGWEPKSRMLREIAAELNIGADSLVFFDDNPVERAEVRENAPEVGVIEVPRDPLAYEAALWDSGFFDQFTLSEEDLGRNAMYRLDRQRRELATQFGSVEDFLHSLEMVAEVGDADPATWGRVAQLINKTNQFNLTTRRRSQSELQAMAEGAGHHVLWLRIRDRFGDQGIVGIAILRLEAEIGIIDTFLMSCRMMNRRVEDALVAELAARARQAGARQLIGEYLPTARNRLVADFYPRFGFEPVGELEGDGRRYLLDLAARELDWPSVIRRSPPH